MRANAAMSTAPGGQESTDKPRVLLAVEVLSKPLKLLRMPETVQSNDAKSDRQQAENDRNRQSIQHDSGPYRGS